MTGNREPEQRKIKTGGGRYIENLGNYFENFEQLVINWLGDKGQAPAKRDSTQQTLLNWVQTEVEGRLEDSLHNRVLITLDKKEAPSQVIRPWSIDVKIGSQPPRRLLSYPKITTIYDRKNINGRFLILGAPGSGKTTTLLQLAQVLINRAQEDINQPIPVLLNLSSWQDDKQSIKDWIIGDLKKNMVSAKMLEKSG